MRQFLPSAAETEDPVSALSACLLTPPLSQCRSSAPRSAFQMTGSLPVSLPRDQMPLNPVLAI